MEYEGLTHEVSMESYLWPFSMHITLYLEDIQVQFSTSVYCIASNSNCLSFENVKCVSSQQQLSQNSYAHREMNDYKQMKPTRAVSWVRDHSISDPKNNRNSHAVCNWIAQVVTYALWKTQKMLMEEKLMVIGQNEKLIIAEAKVRVKLIR